MTEYTCSKCSKSIDSRDTYEYRGVFSCEECFDSVVEERDYQRKAIINEESAKTSVFKSLDMSDSSIGKANRKLLKTQVEIASKESPRLKSYEGRN